jgi:hypothetical protein
MKHSSVRFWLPLTIITGLVLASVGIVAAGTSPQPPSDETSRHPFPPDYVPPTAPGYRLLGSSLPTPSPDRLPVPPAPSIAAPSLPAPATQVIRPVAAVEVPALPVGGYRTKCSIEHPMVVDWLQAPGDLGSLVRYSDLVVEGSAVSNRQDTPEFTVTEFRVNRVYGRRSGFKVATGETLLWRTMGTPTNCDRRSPVPLEGQRYVVFLSYEPILKQYWASAGNGSAAYEVDPGGRVYSLAEPRVSYNSDILTIAEATELERTLDRKTTTELAALTETAFATFPRVQITESTK